MAAGFMQPEAAVRRHPKTAQMTEAQRPPRLSPVPAIRCIMSAGLDIFKKLGENITEGRDIDR